VVARFSGWVHPTNQPSPHLQEIGDVENWAERIEMDMRTVTTALEFVYNGTAT
jgi:hypothetical protein